MSKTDISIDLYFRPITTSVEGAPYQPGQLVTVVDAIDKSICDVSGFVGKSGVVELLEYECDCRQAGPDDPMIGVRFADGELQGFWQEELCLNTSNASCSPSASR